MINLPNNANELHLEGATVPFYTYEENEETYLYFDSSNCGHPEPMINAMVGLEVLAKAPDIQKLIMINTKPPLGLFPKIEKDFDFEIIALENDNTKVVFTKKNLDSSTLETNFNDNNCSG